MKKIINRIKYRIRKFFNIKNDIPKLMSQVEIKAEDRLDPAFINFFIDEEALTYEIGVDKNEAIKRLKARHK